MISWFEVISELFVNLAAGWFALVFIEPQIPSSRPITLAVLTLRLIAGIVSLAIAKRLREEIKKT